MTQRLNTGNDLQGRWTRTTGYNSTYPKGGVSCFADTFVGIVSSVLRMKFSAKNPALRVAANRYKQGYDDHSNNEKSQADKRQKPTQTSIVLFDSPTFFLLKRKLTWRLNEATFAKTKKNI